MRAGRERGSVTAETAAVLTVVALVVVAVISVGSALVGRARAAEAARACARTFSTGQPCPVETAREIAGGAARINCVKQPPHVRVTVTIPLPAPLGTAGLRAEGSAVALDETTLTP